MTQDIFQIQKFKNRTSPCIQILKKESKNKNNEK